MKRTPFRSNLTGVLALLPLAMIALAPARAAAFPPVAESPGPSRFDRQAILIQLKPGAAFQPGGGAHTGVATLDHRLAGADAAEAAPLFPQPPSSQRYRRELRDALGMGRCYRVRLRREADVAALASELSRDPSVEWAEPDYEGSAADAATVAPLVPNDPYFDHEWAFRNTGFVPGLGASTPGADIRATEAWGVTTGDSSVVVAVLDSGIQADAPEFRGRIWTNPGEVPGNGVDDDGNGYVDDVRGWNFAYGNGELRDDLGHGNAVAGVIAANGNDGLGYCGLDWRCRIMPVKILSSEGFGSYSWWASAIVYAVDNGARVLNMSVVGGSLSQVLQTAVRYAEAHGVLLVAAMGNSGQATRYVPAAFDEVLAVGATDRNDHRASFSTYGPWLDVVAPGLDVAVLTLGPETYSSYGSGTSFAAPMAAGLAALLLAKNPSLQASDLRAIIGATADDGVGHDAQDGPGWDPYYGYGRIDAARALELDRIPRAPVVSAPSFLNPTEGIPIAIVATASDPDGDPIQRLDFDRSVLPAGADVSFVVNASNTSGTLTWTPTFEDAGGPYNVAFRAYAPLRGQAITTMYVANVNRPPVLAVPASASFTESEAGQFDVAAADPDGEYISLSLDDAPAGAAFEDHGDNTGSVTWTPGGDQVGAHTFHFTARDGWSDGTVHAATQVEVRRRNRGPTADAGGPYTGVAGAPVAFDGTASSDPDGDALRWTWGFGDGRSGSGAAPEHTYDRGGAFLIALDVSDGSLSASDTTSARVAEALPARAFLDDGRRTLTLSGGSASVRLGLEPVAGAYRNSDVDLATLALTAAGGSAAPDPRDIVEEDRDRNGIAELTLPFNRSALRSIFGSARGRDSVAITVDGRLASGARIRARATLAVVLPGGAIALSSNPLSAGGVITLRTTRPGPWRVRLFDARGRLVRTLAGNGGTASGDHELPFDGRGEHGRLLGSGIYFVRAETPDGSATSRIAVVR